MKKSRLIWAFVLGLSMVLPAATSFASSDCSSLANGLTAKVVATAGQTIHWKIDATGCDVGIYIGPTANQVNVQGATVSGANAEGILVQNAANVTIMGSTVSGNGVAPPNGVTELKAITLIGTKNVRVAGNTVKGNFHGGIRISDDGPTSVSAPIAINSTPIAGTGNQLVGNRVESDTDCGIVVAAVNPGGGLDNNTVSGNSVSGDVSGIVVAGGGYGAVTVTNTLVSGNSVTGGGAEGIPGISLHAFGPGTISGTRITGNKLFKNGVGEVSTQTTGIEIFAIPGVGTISGTQMTGNSVKDDFFGVFHVGDTGTTIVGLSTSGVTVPVAP